MNSQEQDCNQVFWLGSRLNSQKMKIDVAPNINLPYRLSLRN